MQVSFKLREWLLTPQPGCTFNLGFVLLWDLLWHCILEFYLTWLYWTYSLQLQAWIWRGTFKSHCESNCHTCLDSAVQSHPPSFCRRWQANWYVCKLANFIITNPCCDLWVWSVIGITPLQLCTAIQWTGEMKISVLRFAQIYCRWRIIPGDEYVWGSICSSGTWKACSTSSSCCISKYSTSAERSWWKEKGPTTGHWST